MKPFAHILLIAAAALLITVILISGSAEESDGYFTIHGGYTGNDERHVQWGIFFSDSNFDHYTVYRNDTPVKTIYNRTEPYCRDTGLTNGHNYTYQVKVFNSEGEEQDASDVVEYKIGEVGGTMLYDQTWSPAGGPYDLTNMVEQAPGVKLTIGPNTVINGGHRVNVTQQLVDNLSVEGGLLFINNHNVTVRNCDFNLTSVDRYPPGIQFLQCNNTRVFGCTFEGYDPGAWPFTSSPILYGQYYDEKYGSFNATIFNNSFEQNYYCFGAFKLQGARLFGNTFSDNFGGIWFIDLSSAITIFDNTFTNNWGTGVYAKVQSGLTDCHDIVVRDNRFQENDQDLFIVANNSMVRNCTSNDSKYGFVVSGRDGSINNNTFKGKAIDEGVGIECSGSRFMVLDNNISNVRYGIDVGDDDSSDNVTIENNLIADCGDYGIYIGSYDTCRDCTVRENYVARCGSEIGKFPHWPQGGGIWLEGTNTTVIENNTLVDHDGDGICLYRGSNNNEIMNNTITGSKKSGIHLWPYYGAINGMNIHHNTIIGSNAHGIYVRGMDDLNNGYSTVGNTTIRYNAINGNGLYSIYDTAGIYIQLSNNITVEYNVVHHEGDHGIAIVGSDKYPCFKIIVDYNNLSRDHDEDGWDLYDDSRWWPKTGGTFHGNVFGELYPTKADIAGHTETLGIGGVEDVPPMPQKPEHDPGQAHVGVLLDVSYYRMFSDLWIQMHYTDDHVKDINETDLVVWKYNSTGWEEDANNTRWKENVAHSTVLNTFIIEIWTTGGTNQGIIAPLIPISETAGRTVNITIDEVSGTIAPDETITIKGNITILPSGTVQTVKLYLDDIFVKNADTFSEMAYTTTLDLPGDLTEGNHIIKVEAILETGETDTDEETITYTKGPVEHTVTVSMDAIPESIEPGAALTVDGDIEIDPAGDGTAVQSVKYFLDGSYIVDATTFTTSEYSGTLNLPANLTKGDHLITVNVTLETGEFGMVTKTISYYQGTGNYTITITIDQVNEKIEPGARITVSGSIIVTPDANVSEVKFYLNGNYHEDAAAFNNTAFSGAISLPAGLLEGNHEITVRVILQTGNSDTAQRSNTYEIDDADDDDDDDGGMTLDTCFILLFLIIVIFIVLLVTMRSGKNRNEK